MNKASMINEICCGINIRYLPSMYRMTYKELKELYGGLLNIGNDLKEIKNRLGGNNER